MVPAIGGVRHQIINFGVAIRRAYQARQQMMIDRIGIGENRYGRGQQSPGSIMAKMAVAAARSGKLYVGDAADGH